MAIPQQSENCVDIDIVRIPYASRVPLYSSAVDIQIKDEANVVDEITRVTQYRTNATLQELHDYYVSKLPEYGWVLESDNWTPPPEEGSMSFEDPGNGPEGLNTRVTVLIVATDSGETQVTMRAQGRGLETPEYPHK
jgi:hypothetical protein